MKISDTIPGIIREPKKKTWSYFEGLSVLPIRQEEAERFVNSRDKQPYILMYERPEQTVESCLAKFASVEQDLSKSLSQLDLKDDEPCARKSSAEDQQPCKKLKTDHPAFSKEADD